MRRKITIAVAITMLVSAGAAYAALNTYTASFSFSGKAGSKAKPASIGYSEKYAAANTIAGDRAAVLTKIVTKVYGLAPGTGKYFPVCKLSMIHKPNWDKACPKGSLIASGGVHSKLGDHTLTGPGSPCNPLLAVYNGGPNIQTFFFYIDPSNPSHQCLGLHTGASLPWQGTIASQGGYAVETVNLPPDISTNAGIATPRRDAMVHGEKVYVTGDVASTFNPTGTTLAVSFRQLHQPQPNGGTAEYRTDRMNVRIAQSLHLPFDLRVLMGMEVAKNSNSPFLFDTLNTDGTSKKYLGGLAMNF